MDTALAASLQTSELKVMVKLELKKTENIET